MTHLEPSSETRSFLVCLSDGSLGDEARTALGESSEETTYWQAYPLPVMDAQEYVAVELLRNGHDEHHYSCSTSIVAFLIPDLTESH